MMLTTYEKNKLSEMYGRAIAEIYEYVSEKEKSRSGAGTPKAAKVNTRVKYSRDCGKSQAVAKRKLRTSNDRTI